MEGKYWDEKLGYVLFKDGEFCGFSTNYDKDYQTGQFFYNYFFLKENRNQRFSFLNLIFKKYERVQESRSVQI